MHENERGACLRQMIGGVGDERGRRAAAELASIYVQLAAATQGFAIRNAHRPLARTSGRSRRQTGAGDGGYRAVPRV